MHEKLLDPICIHMRSHSSEPAQHCQWVLMPISLEKYIQRRELAPRKLKTALHCSLSDFS